MTINASIEGEEHGQVILGWVHTHPKFAAFLSATDLHFHYSLQRTFEASTWSVVLGYVSEWEGDASPSLAVPDIRRFELTALGQEVLVNCKSQSSQHEHEGEIIEYIGNDARKTSNLFKEVKPKYVARKQKNHPVFKWPICVLRAFYVFRCFTCISDYPRQLCKACGR